MARLQAKILAAFLLTSACQTYHTSSLEERQPITFTEKVLYQAAKTKAVSWIYNTSPLSKVQTVGLKRLKDLGHEFLEDIGGRLVTQNEISFYYFDPKVYQKKESAAYKKWRKKLTSAKNYKLSEMLHTDFQAGTLPSLLRLPYQVTSVSIPLGAILFPDCALESELDPKFIVNYLARGIHVVALSYEGLLNRDTFDRDKLFEATLIVASWLQNERNLQEKDLLFVGKSFGAALATYSAAHFDYSPLIIESGFSRLSDALNTKNPLTHTLVELFYRFPLEDWIAFVKGPILMMDTFHEKSEKLFLSLTKTKKQKETETRWIQTKGGSFGIAFNEIDPVWYEEEKSQEKLNHFLLTLTHKLK